MNPKLFFLLGAVSSSGVVCAANPIVEPEPQRRLLQGVIEPARSTAVKNPVAGRSEILSMVDSGTMLSEGDVICRIRASEQEENIAEIESKIAAMKAAQHSAEAALESHQRQAALEQARQERQVQAVEMELEAWTKGEFPLRTAELKAEIRIARAELELSRSLIQTDALTAVERRKAQVESARAESTIELAELKMKHLQNFLHPQRVAALRSELDIARMESEVQQAEIQREAESQAAKVRASELQMQIAEAKLTEVRENLAAGTILAPHDGVVKHVLQRSRRRDSPEAVVGLQVRENQTLVIVEDQSKLEVVARLKLEQPLELKAGQRAEVRVDAYPDRKFSGIVSSVTSLNDRTSEGQVLRVAIEAEEGLPLKPGMTAEIRIRGRR